MSDDLNYLTGAVDAGAAFHIDEFIFSPTGYEVDLANGCYRFTNVDMPAGIALSPVVSVQCGSVTEGHTVTLVPSLQVDACGGVMRLRDTRRDEYAELPLGRAGVAPARKELLRAARHEDHILTMDATRASVLLFGHYVVRG